MKASSSLAKRRRVCAWAVAAASTLLVATIVVGPWCVAGQTIDTIGDGFETAAPTPPNDEDNVGLVKDCCNDEPIKTNRTLVELGYLTAVKGDMHNRYVLIDA